MDTWRNKEPQDVFLTQKRSFLLETCWILLQRNLLKGTAPIRVVDERNAGQMSKNVFLVATKCRWGLQGGGGASISAWQTHSGVVIVCVTER